MPGPTNKSTKKAMLMKVSAKSKATTTSTTHTTRSKLAKPAAPAPTPSKKRRSKKAPIVSDSEDSDVKVLKPRQKSKRQHVDPAPSNKEEDENIENVEGNGLDESNEEVTDDKEVSTMFLGMIKFTHIHIQDDDLEAWHRAEIEEQKETKNDASRDIFLIFSPWMTIRFKQKGTVKVLCGRWCHLCW